MNENQHLFDLMYHIHVETGYGKTGAGYCNVSLFVPAGIVCSTSRLCLSVESHLSEPLVYCVCRQKSCHPDPQEEMMLNQAVMIFIIFIVNKLYNPTPGLLFIILLFTFETNQKIYIYIYIYSNCTKTQSVSRKTSWP